MISDEKQTRIGSERLWCDQNCSEKYLEAISDPDLSITRSVLCLPTEMEADLGHINRDCVWKRGGNRVISSSR